MISACDLAVDVVLQCLEILTLESELICGRFSNYNPTCRKGHLTNVYIISVTSFYV